MTEGGGLITAVPTRTRAHSDVLAGVDELSDGEAVPQPDVVDVDPAPKDCDHCLHVRFDQIDHVDVVPHTRAIDGVKVGPHDRQTFAVPQRRGKAGATDPAESLGHGAAGGLAHAALWVAADHVKVPTYMGERAGECVE